MQQSNEQQIKNIEARLESVEMTARLGTVTSVDYQKRTATVSWSDGTQSDEMKVLNNGTDWMPDVGECAVSVHRSSGDGWIIGVL